MSTIFWTVSLSAPRSTPAPIPRPSASRLYARDSAVSVATPPLGFSLQDDCAFADEAMPGAGRAPRAPSIHVREAVGVPFSAGEAVGVRCPSRFCAARRDGRRSDEPPDASGQEGGTKPLRESRLPGTDAA